MQMKKTHVEILGIRIYNRDIPSITREIGRVCTDGSPPENRCISATGAHGMITARKDEEFKEILNGFYANLPDGMPGVWVGKLKGEKEMKRCYGPDFFAETMRATASGGIRHFLCGGTEGVAEELKASCLEKFGNANICGTYCPPFKEADEYDYEEIARLINESGADIVWVGISTPKQEKFARNLSRYTKVHFLATVGAAFDFHTDRLKQAPSWMQEAGLEWLFRLLTEPRRLYKRYFEIVPKFLIFSLKDLGSYHGSRLLQRRSR